MREVTVQCERAEWYFELDRFPYGKLAERTLLRTVPHPRCNDELVLNRRAHREKRMTGVLSLCIWQPEYKVDCLPGLDENPAGFAR